MPAHLRVSVPDRPGALAALASALASVGTNVLSVTVVDREHGRAVDDLILDWPYERAPEPLVAAVERCAGVRLHGLRHVRETADSHDADLVAQLLQNPDRSVETVVDALPHVLLADWCAVFDRRRPLEPRYATPAAPTPLPETDGPLGRPRAISRHGESLVLGQLSATTLRTLVGRTHGPPFTRGEVDRCASLLEVAAGIARLAYRDSVATSATDLTAQVLGTVAAT